MGKLVGFMQVFNEIEKGNLQRSLPYLIGICDEVVVYDDASTDGSYEYAVSLTPHVVKGEENDFLSEQGHKQVLLELALSLNPDWILAMDADEIYTRGFEKIVMDLSNDETNRRSWRFHLVNLWRDPNWFRVDDKFNDMYNCLRLWKNTGNLSFAGRGRALHLIQNPDGLEGDLFRDDVQVLHYGFSSKGNIIRKYLDYKAVGQRGWELDRLANENGMDLREVNQAWFPEEYVPEVTDEPEPISYEEIKRFGSYKEYVDECGLLRERVKGPRFRKKMNYE